MNPKSILRGLIEKVGPADTWKGQCFALATAAVKCGLVQGDAVYGMWHGPIAKKSYFYEHRGNLPFVNHGWVNLPDGRICDPTRWVFEAVEPYVYIGPNDHYDEGANRLRAHESPPDYDPTEKIVEVTSDALGAAAWTHMERLLGMDQYVPDDDDEEFTPGQVTVPQLFWIGNRSPDVLAPHAAAIYAALDHLGYGAAVPHDNRLAVERQSARSGGEPSVSSPKTRT
jgi:hypothetical protein